MIPDWLFIAAGGALLLIGIWCGIDEWLDPTPPEDDDKRMWRGQSSSD